VPLIGCRFASATVRKTPGVMSPMVGRYTRPVAGRSDIACQRCAPHGLGRMAAGPVSSRAPGTSIGRPVLTSIREAQVVAAKGSAEIRFPVRRSST